MKFDDFSGNKLKVLNYSGGCSTCPRKLVDYVPPSLRGNKILFVGEVPEEQDVIDREGFKGNSGEFLRSSLSKVGITDFDITTVVKCRPPEGKRPSDKEISCCMNQYTTKEVMGYPIVVLIGAVAAKAFFPEERFKNIRNNVVWHPDYPEQRFYPIHHPGFITRNKSKDMLNTWDKSLHRLKRISEEEPTCPWVIHKGDDSDFLGKLDKILSNKLITFDLETNSLKSWDPNSRIRSLSVCSSEKEALFCYDGDIVWDEAIKRIGKALEDPDKVFVGFNIGFDIDFVEKKQNIYCKSKLLDVQCLYYLSRLERMPSLKYLTAQYLDGYRFLIGNPDSCENIDLLAKYNAEDVIRTLQLAKKELPRLNKKQKDLLFRVSSPSALALTRLTSTGFHFDLEACTETYEQVRVERERILNRWKEFDPAFNPDEHLAGDGLIWYLYTHRKLPVIEETEKSQKPSTNKHTLGRLARDRKKEIFLQWLLRIKTLEKIESTYIVEYLNGTHVDFDQRVHSGYTSTLTKTGRSSSLNPNSQNWSRNDTLNKTMIKGISKPLSIRKNLAARPGNLILHVDYSQLELRIGMVLANDPVGLKAYLEEGDLHMQTARMIAGGEGREATKDDRTYAKPVNFTLLYALRDSADYTLRQTAAKEYGIDLSKHKSKEYTDTFYSTYKHIPKWHNRIIRDLRVNEGHVETVLGFKQYYPDYNHPNKNKREHAEREAINITCQNPAGMLTLYTLYLFQQTLRERELSEVLSVASVHDSILAEVPERLIPEACECMNVAVDGVRKWIKPWFPIPLVEEYEVGPNWSELEGITP